MAIPALALGMVLRTIAKEGMKQAIKKYGKEKVKEARSAAKSPEVRKQAEEAIDKQVKRAQEIKSRGPVKNRELPAGMKVKNNTLMNKGGYANCGASVAPNGKSRS